VGTFNFTYNPWWLEWFGNCSHFFSNCESPSIGESILGFEGTCPENHGMHDPERHPSACLKIAKGNTTCVIMHCHLNDWIWLHNEHDLNNKIKYQVFKACVFQSEKTSSIFRSCKRSM
jgi:hypothetical protein